MYLLPEYNALGSSGRHRDAGWWKPFPRKWEEEPRAVSWQFSIGSARNHHFQSCGIQKGKKDIFIPWPEVFGKKNLNKMFEEVFFDQSYEDLRWNFQKWLYLVIFSWSVSLVWSKVWGNKSGILKVQNQWLRIDSILSRQDCFYHFLYYLVTFVSLSSECYWSVIGVS